jgi:hypothetical protein
MGVSLHYRGKIKSINLVPELVIEVEDICKTNKWHYNIFDEESARPVKKGEDIIESFLSDEDELKKPDLGLRGISFRPHEESESVSLLFDEKGVLRSILSVLFPYIQEDEKMPWAFTKTQFAGVEAHIKLVKLLVYLEKKYFKKFDLRDDGGYYPDNDEEALRQRMGFIDNAIGTLNDIFEHGSFDGDPDEVMGQIQEAISASFKDINIKVMRFDPEEISNLLNDISDDDDTPKSSDKKPRKRRKKDDNDEKND